MQRWLYDNLGLKLLSLLLAALLWAVVLGEQKVEVTVNVPLHSTCRPRLFLVNDPAGYAGGPSARPEDPGHLGDGRAKSAWRELAGEARRGREHRSRSREGLIRVPRGIQVVESSPRRIRVVLEAAVEREVEISPRVEGSPPDGFVVRQVTSNPSRVRMVGPASELRADHPACGHCRSAWWGTRPPSPRVRCWSPWADWSGSRTTSTIIVRGRHRAEKILRRRRRGARDRRGGTACRACSERTECEA